MGFKVQDLRFRAEGMTGMTRSFKQDPESFQTPHLLAWRRHDERPASEDIYGLSVLAPDELVDVTLPETKMETKKGP